MQYLAVSAHPPGSYYHKMGASLKGRGAIQIWCLVTSSETVELSKPPYRVVKRRAKEALTVKDGVENDKQKSLAVIKRRGRPKKVSLTDETNGCQVAKKKKIGRPRKRPTDEEDTSPKVPKKRGRPRKYAQSSNIEEEDKLLLPVSINLEGTGTRLALPPPPDANSTQKGRKGRCKKGNFRSQEVCPVASGAKLNADMDKDLQCFEMAQKGHNDAADNEANPLPIVEPLDVALPLAVLYEKKHNKRRLKEKQPIQKPDVVAAENSIVEYVTSSECQIVEPNLTETQCNAEAKLASSVCCPKEMLLPKLVFCLAHYGKVAWDIKWKPFATSSTARMGYLAALLGDGSLEVYVFLFSCCLFFYFFFFLRDACAVAIILLN